MDLILPGFPADLMSVTGTTNGERIRCGYSVAMLPPGCLP